jgi:hypothetical protein
MYVLSLSLLACSLPEAADVGFDPTASGLVANNVQAAIDGEAAARSAVDAEHQVTIASVEGQGVALAALTDTVASVSSATDGNTARLDALTAFEVGFDDSALALGAADVQSAIEALAAWNQAQVDAVSAEIISLQGRVAALESGVTSVTADLAGLDALVAALEESLTAVETDIDAVESELACPTGSVAVNGGCIEENERLAAATGCSQFLVAAQECATDGMRLCSTGEWLGACYAAPAGLNDMSGNYEIIADLTSAGSFVIAGAAGCSNFGEAECGSDGNLGLELAYRCCR